MPSGDLAPTREVTAIAAENRDGLVGAEGLRLHYVEWGDAGAQPLVLLHGLSDCARSWDRFAAGMSSDHRVVALDYRGHGESRWAAPGSYRLEDYVSDIEAVVDRLSLMGLVLVGHAEGGRSAVAYSAAHPELVEALVVVDSDLRATGQESQHAPENSAGEPGEWGSLDEVVEHLREQRPNSTDETLAHQALYLTTELPGERRGWKRDPAVLAASERRDLWDEWRTLRCPVLVACGRQSHVVDHALAVRMREAARRVRLAELEGGGHWFHQEIPGAFEATVRWFLRSPPP